MDKIASCIIFKIGFCKKSYTDPGHIKKLLAIVQCKIKGSTLTFFSFSPYVPVVEQDNFLRDSQPYACSLKLIISVQAMKNHKKFAIMPHVKTISIILHIISRICCLIDNTNPDLRMCFFLKNI